MRPEIYKEMAQVQDRHWWFVARRRILDRVITALKLPGDAQILEIGCGPGGNLARYAALAAGVDPAVPCLTVDRQCGSGLAAIEVATWRLRGQAGFVLAGGAQSVSTQPLTAWPAVAGACCARWPPSAASAKAR